MLAGSSQPVTTSVTLTLHIEDVSHCLTPTQHMWCDYI